MRDVRGFGFILCGFIWCIMGFGVSQGFFGTDPSLPLVAAPLFWREALWMVPGILAFVAAYNDRLHGVVLAALVVAPLARVVSYTWAWAMYLIPQAPPGYERGWYAAVIHLSFIGVVVLVASIPHGRRHTWGLRDTPSSGA